MGRALGRPRRAHRAAQHRRQAGAPERPAQLEHGAVDRAGDVVRQRRRSRRAPRRAPRAASRRRTCRSPRRASRRSAPRPAGACRCATRRSGRAGRPAPAPPARSGRGGRRSAPPSRRAGRAPRSASPGRRRSRAATSPTCSSIPTRTRGSGSSPNSSGSTSRRPAQPRVDRAEIGDGRDVGAREAAQLARVGAAREQQRVRRAAVAPGAADHLDVALERLGVVVERDEPDVGLVDAHAERGRRDDGLDPALDEGLLRGRALLRLEAGVVVDGGEIVDAERARQALAAPSRAGVDDRRGAAKVVQPPDERAQAVLLAVDDLDVVAQVRPDDARADDLGLPAERGRDLPLRRRGRRRRHAEDRRPAERVESAADEEVVGPEVVAPHADAVHLVDHDEADVDPRDRVEEVPLAEPLGGDVEEPVAALGRRRAAARRPRPGRATS